MENYKNLSGTSAVLRYEIGADYITVEFNGGRKRFYKYTYSSAGAQNIEEMKGLASKGAGLNTFINIKVKKLYESSW